MAYAVIGVSALDPNADVLWGPFPSPWEASEYIEHMNEVGISNSYAEVVAVTLNTPDIAVTPIQISQPQLALRLVTA